MNIKDMKRQVKSSEVFAADITTWDEIPTPMELARLAAALCHREYSANPPVHDAYCLLKEAQQLVRTLKAQRIHHLRQSEATGREITSFDQFLTDIVGGRNKAERLRRFRAYLEITASWSLASGVIIRRVLNGPQPMSDSGFEAKCLAFQNFNWTPSELEALTTEYTGYAEDKIKLANAEKGKTSAEVRAASKS